MNSDIEIPFHEISIKDYGWYKNIADKVYMEAADYPFASNYIWKDTYHTEIALIEGCAVYRYEVDNCKWYAYPISSDNTGRINCLKRLQEMSHKKGEPLRITIITKKFLAEINSEFHGKLEIDPIRDAYDYMYEQSRLATLSGKKLAAKRNHIHRFEDGGDWQYEELSAGNMHECWQLELDWIESQDSDDDLLHEKAAIRSAMDHFEELGFFGGLIRREGRVVAFTIAEALNSDTLVVHFEKAYADIQGAYQIINQQFAYHNPQYTYINREDDTGDAGLRRSKLSYHPDRFIEKYIAVESDYTYATEADSEDIIELWQTCFGDERRYVEFYIERMFDDNNLLCIRRDRRIVSMASFLPAFYVNGEYREEVKYVYAVATLPEYRRQGLAGDLLKHAADKYGMPLVLCPADEKLEEYYEGLGYVQAFGKNETIITVNNTGMLEYKEYKEYKSFDTNVVERYRNSFENKLAQTPHISWDNIHIKYAMEENAYTGGALAEFEEGFILYSETEDYIEVIESTIDEDNYIQCVTALAKDHSCKKVKHTNKGGMMLTTANTIYSKDGYLGLTLG